MFEDDLSRAMVLIKSGNKIDARKVLEQIVQEDPQNEKTWMWLADTYPDIPNRIAVLQECLRYKPDNLIARKWLATVKQAEVKEDKLSQESPDLQQSRAEHIPGIIEEATHPENLFNRNSPEQRSGSHNWFVFLGSVILCGLCIFGIWLFQRQRALATSQSINPLSTPSDTATATIIPSLTYTSTRVPRPTLPPIAILSSRRSLIELNHDDLQNALLKSSDLNFNGFHKASDWSIIDPLWIDSQISYVSQSIRDLPIPTTTIEQAFSTDQNLQKGDQVEEGVYIFQDESQSQKYYDKMIQRVDNYLYLYNDLQIQNLEVDDFELIIYQAKGYGSSFGDHQNIQSIAILLARMDEINIKMEFLYDSQFRVEDLTDLFKVAIDRISAAR